MGLNEEWRRETTKESEIFEDTAENKCNGVKIFEPACKEEESI